MLFNVYAGLKKKKKEYNYLKWELVPIKHISVGDETNVMTHSEIFCKKKKVWNACLIACILERILCFKSTL